MAIEPYEPQKDSLENFRTELEKQRREYGEIKQVLQIPIERAEAEWFDADKGLKDALNHTLVEMRSDNQIMINAWRGQAKYYMKQQTRIIQKHQNYRDLKETMENFQDQAELLIVLKKFQGMGIDAVNQALDPKFMGPEKTAELVKQGEVLRTQVRVFMKRFEQLAPETRPLSESSPDTPDEFDKLVDDALERLKRAEDSNDDSITSPEDPGR